LTALASGHFQSTNWHR